MAINTNMIILKRKVGASDPLVLIDFLEKQTQLSKSVLKKILNNGGVWVKEFTHSKLSRIRRATFSLNVESWIEFFYDPKLLLKEVPKAVILEDFKEWGFWYKPPGLLSEGSEFGDHFSIIRQVEKIKNKAFLVHRLDREAEGLMLIAYTKKAAGLFSALWQKHEIQKFYLARVLGVLKNGSENEINFPLDKKEARTSFKILKTEEFTSTLLVQIHTGRLHQIRRHMEMIGHPVLGDPKYGVGNKNTGGLCLKALRLVFIDPFTHKERDYQLPLEYQTFLT